MMTKLSVLIVNEYLYDEGLFVDETDVTKYLSL